MIKENSLPKTEKASLRASNLAKNKWMLRVILVSHKAIYRRLLSNRRKTLRRLNLLRRLLTCLIRQQINCGTGIDTSHMELLRHNDELDQRLREADALHQSIESESAKPDDVRDEGWILAQKRRLTWCEDTTRVAYEMARLYQEASAILQTFAKRDSASTCWCSYSKNGLVPGSQSEVRSNFICQVLKPKDLGFQPVVAGEHPL